MSRRSKKGDHLKFVRSLDNYDDGREEAITLGNGYLMTHKGTYRIFQRSDGSLSLSLCSPGREMVLVPGDRSVTLKSRKYKRPKSYFDK